MRQKFRKKLYIEDTATNNKILQNKAYGSRRSSATSCLHLEGTLETFFRNVFQAVRRSRFNLNYGAAAMSFQEKQEKSPLEPDRAIRELVKRCDACRSEPGRCVDDEVASYW